MGCWRWEMGFVLAVLITLAPVTWAQTSSPTPTVAEETAPVVLDGQELFRVPPANVRSAQERAKIIASRLEQVAQAENGPIEHHLTILRVGGTLGILAEPAPWVWQTARNDFYVSYAMLLVTNRNRYPL